MNNDNSGFIMTEPNEDNPFVKNEATVTESNTQPQQQMTPPTPQFQQQSPPNFFNQNANQSQPKQKYNIVDLYWLINNKLFHQKKLEKNEASLISIGFNADFQNLRITFLGTDNNTFTNTHILLNNTQRLSTTNIHSEMAQQILYYLEQAENTKEELNITLQNFERMIQTSANWSPNQTYFVINPKEVVLQSSNQNGKYIFTFLDWQIEALKNACRFMTNGDAWKLQMQNIFNK